MASDRVKTVIVGGGNIAKLHAGYLRASDSCELVAVVDPFDSGRQLAESLSTAHYTSIDELLAAYPSPDSKPELYYVCTPSALHVPIAIDIITKASPKAILVEKPLSTETDSGTKLISLAREKGCKLHVGHHRRFHPRVVAAKDVVQSGKLGELTAVTSLWACKKNDGYYTEAPWRASRVKGGGPVWTNLVHDVDVLSHIVGSRIVRLWAKSTRRRRTPPSEDVVASGDLTEEGAAIMLEFENGVVGTLILSDNVASPYSWESATGENPQIASNTSEGSLDTSRFFGTEGTLSAPDGIVWKYSQDVANSSGQEVGWGVPMTREVIRLKEGIPLQRQAEHMIRVARGLEEPLCSGEEGLAAVQVCEAIVKALDGQLTGPMELPSLG
ncbi:oxidoreductase family, NAD-binding rossmann fold domain-containing protein [Sarocladium implicatum]|nr:oxidoreductase family, NAD-binding rossmann fold domain-containing protein [Sarocladium implicatum]